MASTCVGHQLVLTVGLLAVVVYLYTVVAFNFFRKFYNKSEDEDEPDMKCDDMMTVSVCAQSTAGCHCSTNQDVHTHHFLLCLPAVLSLPHVRGGEGWRRHRGRDRGPGRRPLWAVPYPLWHHLLLLRHRHPPGHYPGWALTSISLRDYLTVSFKY